MVTPYYFLKTFWLVNWEGVEGCFKKKKTNKPWQLVLIRQYKISPTFPSVFYSVWRECGLSGWWWLGLVCYCCLVVLIDKCWEKRRYKVFPISAVGMLCWKSVCHWSRAQVFSMQCREIWVALYRWSLPAQDCRSPRLAVPHNLPVLRNLWTCTLYLVLLNWQQSSSLHL